MALHSRLFVRIMSRNRDVYFLKILTLSIAFASSIFITLFSIHEFTYDLFPKNPERVFRVLQKNTDEHYHGNRLAAKIPAAVVDQLQDDHKDALHIARVKIMNKVTVLFQDKPFMDQKIHAVDTSIRQIFSFKIVDEEPGTDSQSTGTTIWLSASAALQFTNSIDAVGKHLKLFTFNDTVEARVAAVFKDFPKNTHEDFEILVNFDSATIAALNFNPEETGVYGRVLKGEPENYITSDGKFSYIPQSLAEIHFGPRVLHEEARHGDLYSIIILTCIASLILFLALSSFVNLTTITLPYRSKELAVKKLGGVGQVRLFLGFLRESGALVGTSLLIGVLILAFSSNYLASILKVDILSLFRMFDIKLFITIGILFVILTVSPALTTLKFIKANPTRLLSTDTITFPKFKRIITVLQLGISIFLIVASVVVRRQINYSLVKEPGANHDQIVYLHSPTGLTNEGIASMRTNWKIFNPNVVDVMAVSQLPDRLSSKEVGSEFYSLLVDPGYLDFFEYKMRKGNWFKANDGDSIIVTNAKGFEMMAMGDANVIGVIQDLGSGFNQPEKPIKIKLAQDYNYNWLCIRVLEVDIRRTVSRLSDDFSYNGKKADVHFFNKHFESWINYQDRLNILSALLTIISGLLACCAIYGLTVSLVRDKLKQIAVHKLFGARILHVTRLLVSELMKQMILALIFFGPVTYILLNELLRTFTYATKFSWLDPVYPIVYCVFVIVGLCGYQAFSLNRRDFSSALKARA